ncbi:MAG: histone deacetylase [Candidatus Riflebacteria bacterium]|nr:histone deacetylase [Candidatus Riflebacteria bacterium]
MLKADKRLALVFFPAFDWAISPTHPEREERLLYTQDQVLEEGIEDIDGIEMINPVPASIADIQRVHLCVPDVETRVSSSHLISAGGAIEAGRRVLLGKADRAFAIVRPPGHHAHRIVHGDRGFCVINIEAIMIERLRHEFGARRIAIVDTDCHHGDGTQDIYWNDPDTLFISLHQDGRTIYPGTGFPEEFGGPSAIGGTINIPLPQGTGDEGYMYVFDRLVLPILRKFKPDLIINSAGQDNHYTDPITNMRLSAQGYAELNRRLAPDIAVLEGGYSICGALPYVNLGIILAMAGLDFSHVREPDYDAELLREGPRTMPYLKTMCDQIENIVGQRDEIERRVRGAGQIVKRFRRLFYDTDGISETQHEEFHLCPKCPGVQVLESAADVGDNIFVVQVPRAACSDCCGHGINLYERADAGSYSRIFLQDRPNDRLIWRP